MQGKKLEPLIAGYGIRWNIKYESRRRAYNAREVSHSLKQQNEAIVDIIESGYRCNALWWVAQISRSDSQAEPQTKA